MFVKGNECVNGSIRSTPLGMRRDTSSYLTIFHTVSTDQRLSKMHFLILCIILALHCYDIVAILLS